MEPSGENRKVPLDLRLYRQQAEMTQVAEGLWAAVKPT